MIEITGRTKVVALLGHPVWQSPLPALVNAAFESLTLPYALVPFNVDEAKLKEALSSLRSLGMIGAAVAPPHKETLCPLLDELGPTSQMTRAVDAVSVSGSRLIGHNTEFWSFLSAVKEEGIVLKGKRALLIGAGGTARSIAAALLKEGAASLAVCNRTRSRAERLAEHCRNIFPAARVSTLACQPDDFRSAVRDSDLLINATPSGLESPKGPLVRENDLHPALVVFDALYTPATPLLLLARRVGCTAVAGTRMLLWQVCFSVRQWTGELPPQPRLQRAMETLLVGATSPA